MCVCVCVHMKDACSLFRKIVIMYTITVLFISPRSLVCVASVYESKDEQQVLQYVHSTDKIVLFIC